ncbi:hypothetical protein [Wansuia hejianensis]|uniref:Uncharacterized protein n=1 Tax=Wansuia hejianensis TaxID=2763667 RepID=A0A926EW97_9FIRM|nr:hypothetical protein [Wansuia hejianensis]MBC8589670.1 hypothetical protein [Wansuia hejianensis]
MLKLLLCDMFNAKDGLPEDCEEFQNKKKYLSVKLLIYFAKHPLVFI